MSSYGMKDYDEEEEDIEIDMQDEDEDADMEDDNDEEFEFEYEDEDEDDDMDVNIENEYYNAKGLMEQSFAKAAAGFEKVLQMETTKGKWGFKALKQLVKAHFREAQYDEMMTRYNELLSYIKSSVTRNEGEKVINSILDFVSIAQQPVYTPMTPKPDNSKHWGSTSSLMSDSMDESPGVQAQSIDMLELLYDTTLKALTEAKNERLWFNTSLKLAKLYYRTGQFTRLQKTLKELHRACQNPDGSHDLTKGTQLLEVFALQIQMYTAQKNNKKLKELYKNALAIKSAIPHPRIQGVIRECGGKMHMRERNWKEAYTEFFEAFKNYDEAGAPRKIDCLKYAVLANMLMNSEINPFDSQESKPYTNNEQIVAMTQLVEAYQHNDIERFEKVLRSNRDSIMADVFIRDYIEDLLKGLRVQVLLKLIKPYKRIRVQYISRALNIPERDVEELLVGLILDEQVLGRIDQVKGILELSDRGLRNETRYEAMLKWTSKINDVRIGVQNKLN